MAERKRRDGKDASGRRAGESGTSKKHDLDEDVLADDVDLVDEADEVDAGDGDDGEVADDEVKAKSKGDTSAADRKKSAKAAEKSGEPSRVGGVFGRFINFVREVVAELRKVIWPTRHELITYTTVVVAFVTIMLTIVGLLDYGFTKAVLYLFSTKTGG